MYVVWNGVMGVSELDKVFEAGVYSMGRVGGGGSRGCGCSWPRGMGRYAVGVMGCMRAYLCCIGGCFFTRYQMHESVELPGMGDGCQSVDA